MQSRNPADVCRDTGLPYHWLVHFKNGRYKNPSVNRVQVLYEHLSGKELEL